MAYRLYDTVNDDWIELDTQEELDNLFNSSDNKPVKTKNYGMVLRYETSRPTNTSKVADIAIEQAKQELYKAPIKGRTFSGNAQMSELIATAGLPIGKQFYTMQELNAYTRASGFEPSLWLQDEYFKEASTGQYFHYNASTGLYEYDDEVNMIGSAKRRELFGEELDFDEYVKDNWLSEYYKCKKPGEGYNLSTNAKDSYNITYEEEDEYNEQIDKKYDKYSIDVMSLRALNTASKGEEYAVKKYCETHQIPEDNRLWEYAKLSNKELWERAKYSQEAASILDSITDEYIVEYYRAVLEKYKDTPTTISQDIHGENSELNRLLENGQDYIRSLAKTKIGGAFQNFLWSTSMSFGYSLLPDIYNRDRKYENKQRDRANAALEAISKSRADSSYEELKYYKQEDPEKYEDERIEALNNFEAAAADANPYYTRFKSVLESDLGLNDEQKIKMYYQYADEARTLGEELAYKRFSEKITNMVYDGQDGWDILGDDCMNTLYTFAGTTAQIAGFIIEYRAGFALASDLVKSGYQSIAGDATFGDAFIDNIDKRWENALNMGMVTWGENLQNTGRILTKNQQKELAAGTSYFQVMKEYGEEEAFSIHDAIPVIAMTFATAGTARGMNMLTKGMRGVSAFVESAELAAAIEEGFATTSTAKRTFNILGKVAKPFSAGARKFGMLNKTATYLDITAPTWTTVGMDFGYSKGSYDRDISDAYNFVGKVRVGSDEDDIFDKNLRYDRASQEFLKYLYSNAAVGRFVDNPENNIDIESFGGRSEAIAYFKEAMKKDPNVFNAIYQSEATAYLNEAKEDAKFDAAVTLGTTILPDGVLANTWKRALFAPSTRGPVVSAINDAKRMFHIKTKPASGLVGNVTVESPGVYNLTYTPATRWNYIIKPYLKASAGSFISNYLQDTGVAAGKATYELRMNEYLDQHYSLDAADKISHNIDDIIYAATTAAGKATTEYGSFRDGLYGAIAGIGTPQISRNNKKNTGFMRRTRDAMDFLGLPAWKMTLGSSSILDRENRRRREATAMVESWLKEGNGKAFLESVGGLVEISKQEKEALMNGDFDKVQDTKLAKIATASIMMALLGRDTPIVGHQLEYMKERVKRGEITQEKYDAAMEIVNQFLALKAEGKDAEANKLLDSNEELSSIAQDLVWLDTESKQSAVEDTRSHLEKLNDLRKYSERFIECFENVERYIDEANSMFEGEADAAVIQEYAKMKLLADLIRADIKDQEGIINTLHSKITFTDEDKKASSTVSTTSSDVLMATFGWNIEKALERQEDLKKSVQSSKDDIRLNKENINKFNKQNRKGLFRKKKTLSQEEIGDINVEQLALSLNGIRLLAAQKELGVLTMAINEFKKRNQNVAEGEESKAPLIVAKDIATLEDTDRLKLITSKTLNTAQKSEVEKFLEAIKRGNPTEKSDYVRTLKAIIEGRTKADQVDIKKRFDPETVKRLNSRAENTRANFAKQLIKNNLQGFVNDLNNTTNYEEFAQKLFQKQVSLEEKTDEDASLEWDALTEMLKDNELFKKYAANLSNASKFVKDMDKYLRSTDLSAIQKEEIRDIIIYTSLMKGIEGKDALNKAASQDDTFYKSLAEYLNHIRTSGSASDIKGRIIQYNNAISEEIERQRLAEEERRKRKPVDTATDAAAAIESSTAEAIKAALNTYLSSSSTTEGLRKLAKAVGITNIERNTVDWSDDLLREFEDIIRKAIECNTLEEMVSTIKKATEEAIETTSVNKNNLNGLVAMLLNSIHHNSLKPLTTITSPVAVAVTPTTAQKEAKKSIIDNKDWNFANVPADSHLGQACSEASKVLERIPITKDTKIVFIVDNTNTPTRRGWTANTIEGMGDKYNSSMHLPVLGAIEIDSSTASNYTTAVEIDGKYYVPLGVVPRSGTNISISKIRANASEVKDGTMGLVMDNTSKGEPLYALAQNFTHFSKDTEAEPTKITEIGGTILTSKDVWVVDTKSNPDGTTTPRHAEMRWHKGNISTQGNTADNVWIETQDIEKTTDKDGKPITDYDNIEEFNSRTRGFIQTLRDIISYAVTNSNIQDPFKAISTEDSTKKGAEPTLPNINRKVSDKVGNLGLSQFISLASAYRWGIMGDKSGNIYLTIVDRSNGNPAQFNGKKAIVKITSTTDYRNGNTELASTANEIFNTLMSFKDSDGNCIIKWQVSYGNFDLKQGADKKVPYIREAVSDGVLVGRPTVMTSSLSMSPVQTSRDRAEIAAQAAEVTAQAEAAALVEKGAFDAEGALNVGISAEDIKKAAELFKKGHSITEAIQKQLNKVYNAIISNRRSKDIHDRNHKINQVKNSESTGTSVTSVSNNQQKGSKQPMTKEQASKLIMGNCVDHAVRTFFTPGASITAEKLFEDLGEVFNRQSCQNLYDALVALNESFKARGWRVVSSDVFIVDSEANNERIGELDLLIIDSSGALHVVDVKTYSGEFHDGFKEPQGYSKQVSQYRDYLIENSSIPEQLLPEENLHIVALKVKDTDSRGSFIYNGEFDVPNDMWTLTKNSKYQSVIQIEAPNEITHKGFFEMHDSTTPNVPIKYVGKEEVDKLKERRRNARKGKTSPDSSAQDAAKPEPLVKPHVEEATKEETEEEKNKRITKEGEDLIAQFNDVTTKLNGYKVKQKELEEEQARLSEESKKIFDNPSSFDANKARAAQIQDRLLEIHQEIKDLAQKVVDDTVKAVALTGKSKELLGEPLTAEMRQAMEIVAKEEAKLKEQQAEEAPTIRRPPKRSLRTFAPRDVVDRTTDRCKK